MAENDAPERTRCPFCSDTLTEVNGNKWEENFRVTCIGCLAQSGRYRTRAEAVKAWNIRADLTAPDAAQWSDEIPKVNGFYWVQQADHTPYVVEFEDGFAFFTGVERCSDHFSNDHKFLGPLQPTNGDAVRQARRETQLTRALEKIADGDTDCTCTHEDEFCCVRQGHYCPFCIAVVALRAEGKKGEGNG